MHEHAKNVMSTSDVRIVNQIKSKVNETETSWMQLENDIIDLCEKYENAIMLWEQYHSLQAKIEKCLDDLESMNDFNPDKNSVSRILFLNVLKKFFFDLALFLKKVYTYVIRNY